MLCCKFVNYLIVVVNLVTHTAKAGYVTDFGGGKVGSNEN